jgi:hypothetical protein
MYNCGSVTQSFTTKKPTAGNITLSVNPTTGYAYQTSFVLIVNKGISTANPLKC